MNKDLTEMVFILDRSGSMAGLETDTIGGYNSMIDKQKKEHGEATVTTVLFDDKCDIICENADINKVDHLTEREYFARGCTALLDAIGKTIAMVSERHKTAPDSQIPFKTIVTIITDGYENASCEYSLSRIKEMISYQEKEHRWEFLFLGANIDAVEVAGGFGIAAHRAATYSADSVGTRKNFEAVSNVTRDIRMGCNLSPNWKEDIENYRRKRGK